jgi:hypothetical protein
VKANCHNFGPQYLVSLTADPRCAG